MKPEHIATIREALEMARHEIAEDTEYLEMHLRHSPVFVTRQQELKSSCIAIDAALAALDELTPLDMPDGPGIVTGAGDANAV